MIMVICMCLSDQKVMVMSFLSSGQHRMAELQMIKHKEQVGAEQCQAQAQVGLPAEAELMLSFMYVLPSFQNCFRLY